MIDIKKVKLGITHNGKFHADDVFSTAFLKYLNPDIIIERKSNKEASTMIQMEDVIVYDVGRGEYDHHDPHNVVTRPDGTPYASFGLLWHDYGPTLVSKELVSKFDEDFIKAIDFADNGGPIDPMSYAISMFDVRKEFIDAVDFASQILSRMLNKLRIIDGCLLHLYNLCEETSSEGYHTVVMTQEIELWESVVNSFESIYFVIYPSARGGYSAHGVPIYGTRNTKIPFPKEWTTKSASELNQIIPGLTFCHAKQFMINAATLTGALDACNYTYRESLTYQSK